MARFEPDEAVACSRPGFLLAEGGVSLKAFCWASSSGFLLKDFF